jgi:hypothetical protein
MQRTRTGTWVMVVTAGLSAFVAGCGGGGLDVDNGSPFDQAGNQDDASGGDVAGGDVDLGDLGTAPGALVAGAVTVSVEPGHAMVTVDGRTIDHHANDVGGVFRCTFSDERIALEVNSSFGSMTLSVDGGDDGWVGRFTADSDEGDDSSWIQYSAQPFDGELGIDSESNTLSYMGTAVRQDRIAMSDGNMDTPTVDVTVAVNCGIEPAALEVGGETFTFPLFEADSTTCTVAAPDSIDIMINYLGTEDRQLQFDVRPDGDGLIGGVTMLDGGERWSSVISTGSGSAEGLSFDGSTVTYTGTFEHTSDSDPDQSEDAEGTVVVTCPT